jgi:hypothetical protein
MRVDVAINQHAHRSILRISMADNRALWKSRQGSRRTAKVLSMTDRQELMAEISQEEARLAALKAEVEESCARLVALRKQLAAELPARIVLPTPLAPETASAAMTNAAKVAVFRSLFRGRKDVFPRRWENAKTGKSAYSPACVNEWDYGLCEKKKGPEGAEWIDAFRRWARGR